MPKGRHPGRWDKSDGIFGQTRPLLIKSLNVTDEFPNRTVTDISHITIPVISNKIIIIKK